MRLEHMVTAAIGHMFGHVVRRAMLLCLMLALAMVALYHATIAGTLALEAEVSALQARVIVAGIYAAFALIAGIASWTMRTKPAGTPALSSQREMQMAMLVEAVMVGYALAKKGERAS